MPIVLHRLPEVLETYFLDEARTIPTAYWSCATGGSGFLGPGMRRLVGKGIMAGWALTVSAPPGDEVAGYLALQFMLDTAKRGRWVMVVAPPEGAEPSGVAVWSHIQCAMGWEIGFVGAVVAGYVRDIDEITLKLEKDFNVFGYGGSPIAASQSPEGEVGGPVRINRVTVRTGDLVVGDSDGVICVPKDQVESAAEKCRTRIIDEVNLLQHVREGMGAVDVMGLGDLLAGQVDVV